MKLAWLHLAKTKKQQTQNAQRNEDPPYLTWLTCKKAAEIRLDLS